MKGLRIFLWAMIVIGTAMLAGALALAQNTHRFLARAAHAPGVVTDLIPHYSSDSTTYAPRVRFGLPDGQQIDFVSSSSANPPAYATGEAVDVLYLPDHPQKAKLNGYFSLWGGATIVGAMGAICFAVGFGVALAQRASRRKEQDLLLHGTPVMADFQSVEQNTQLKVNGRSPWRVMAQWRNPSTGQIHVFHSQNLWYDPSAYIERTQLTVYLDPARPKRYYMDVSFLPKMAE